MESLKYYFPDHFGCSPGIADISLYETTWNNYGYHGSFEFNIRSKIKYRINKILLLPICRIDGNMKERHELRYVYSPSNKCFSKLSEGVYISFPSKDLCLTLLLNYTKEQRINISKSLCFNFGEGPDFNRFKSTEQYKKSILRYCNEELFLNNLKECKQILFCDLDLNYLLDRDDISINKTT